jgi:hypothetical protein
MNFTRRIIMRRIAIIVLMGSVLAACSPTVPPPTFAHKHVAPKAWIDPPEVGEGPGVPNPAGLN